MTASKILCRIGLCILVAGAFFRYLPTWVSATEVVETSAQILLVNQVRGNECCQPGNLSTFSEQLKTAHRLNLPTTFSLRYDALNDPAYVAMIKAESDSDLIDWGLFFEVTPALATDAGVPYVGTPATWSRAQHAFTLGYTKAERQRLVTTVMTRFLTVVQEKPALVSAWMLDATTAQILKNDYGIKLVQITREQWGTDSYTLYGGPVHYPYRASNNWLLAPTQTTNNLLVVRQTITDPLWNYGDRFSRFTSQPNDFSQDGKTFDYFRLLLEQAVNQPVGQRGWGLIGLENSMENSYQQLFHQQLELVAALRDQQKLQITTPTQLAIVDHPNIQMYVGDDLTRGTTAKVAWISTPIYQVRVRLDQDQLYINDLRLYSETITDPYMDLPARSRGYWITPFLLDGSKINQVSDQTNYQKWEKGVISPLDPTNDVSSLPQRLELGSINSNKYSSWKEFWLKTSNYIQFTDGEKQIIFSLDTITLHNWTMDEIQYLVPAGAISPIIFTKDKSTFDLTWFNQEEAGWQLVGKCRDDTCELTFNLKAEAVNAARKTSPELLFPEQLINVVDVVQSDIYLHNQYLVKGKQLARIVFIPRSTSGISVEIDHPLNFQTENSIRQEEVQLHSLSQPVQFYDFSALEPGESIISTSDYDLNFSTLVYVAPNCKNELLLCVTHPKWFWWYIQSFIQSRTQLQEQTEQPWLKV